VGERYTIFGGRGFIGSEIAGQLERNGCDVVRIGRHDWPEPGAHLGHVIFTVGMTADFRRRLLETVQMQVMRPYDALTRYRFDSFLSLSSARIYDGATSTAEDATIIVKPTMTDHIYNISKLAGESLCFAFDNPTIRIVRLSNVYGAADRSNLFMTSVLREAVTMGRVEIGQSPDSAKDYIAVDDAARLIIAIVRDGRHRIYNVACGTNFSHRQIAAVIETKGLVTKFRPGGPTVTFPRIDISRVQEEFGLSSRHPDQVLPGLIDDLLRTKDLS
jgi:nucleoside-diphosphate-sugar epimerase